MNLFGYLTDPTNWTGDGSIVQRLLEHLLYSGLALALAALVALPLGTIIGHTRRGDLLVAGTSNAARSVPTLGLLVLVVTLLGTGLFPVVVSLAVLAVPPILNATAAGVKGADRAAVDAGQALGMNPWQVVAGVELPLAGPLVISGVRSAALQVIATATVAAIAAAGGLGRLIVDGQHRGSGGYPEMLAGAVMVAALALAADLLLGGLALVLRQVAHRRTRRPVRSARQLAAT